VTTRHAIGIPRGEYPDLFMLNSVRFGTHKEGALFNIVVDEVAFETDNPDQEYHDALIFTVAGDEHQSANDAYAHFEIGATVAAPYCCSIFVGYPSKHGRLEYGKLPKLKLAKMTADCVNDPGYSTNADYLRRYRILKTVPSLDGFSGGSVFSLYGEAGAFVVKWGGMIVRGGGDFLYVVDEEFFIRMLTEP
jgi:hypothetical protein